MRRHESISGAMERKRSVRAFTFAEVLAAMVFVAILFPVVMQAISVANRAGVAGARKRTAAQLADTLLAQMILTGDWESTLTRGDFEDDYPGYRWELEQETWGDDMLVLLTVEVFYTVQGREFSIRLSTVVDESEEEATAGSTQTGAG